MNRVTLALMAAVALPIAVLAQTGTATPPADNVIDPAANTTEATNNTTDAMSNTSASDNTTTDTPPKKDKKKPMDATE